MRFISVLFILCITNLALASDKKLKIAIVDIQIVLDNSSAIQGIWHTVNTISENLQQKFRSEEQILKDKENQLLVGKNGMQVDEFQRAVTEFNDKVTNTQREEQNQKMKLEQAHAEALNLINATTLKIINDIAYEQEFDLILPSSQILYVSDQLNITKEVLNRLNAKLPSLSLKF